MGFSMPDLEIRHQLQQYLDTMQNLEDNFNQNKDTIDETDMIKLLDESGETKNYATNTYFNPDDIEARTISDAIISNDESLSGELLRALNLRFGYLQAVDIDRQLNPYLVAL